MDTVTDFAALPAEAARNKYNLGKDARGWKIDLAQKDLNSSEIDTDKAVSYHRAIAHNTELTHHLLCRGN